MIFWFARKGSEFQNTSPAVIHWRLISTNFFVVFCLINFPANFKLWYASLFNNMRKLLCQKLYLFHRILWLAALRMKMTCWGQLYCSVVPSSVEEKHYEHKTFFLSITAIVKNFIRRQSALAPISISFNFCFFLVFVNSLMFSCSIQ